MARSRRKGHRRSAVSHGLLVWGAALGLWLAGCGGGSGSDERAGGTSGQAGGEATFETREGGGLSPGTSELGTLQPVSTGSASADVGAEGTPAAQTGRLIAEPGERGEAVGLREGAFEADGFRIVQVPRGVRFHRTDLSPATWEVVDGRGRRLALVQQQPWSRAATPGSATAERGADTRRELSVTDWGGGAARIVVEQLSDERYIYRIERRAGGSTDWIQRRWRWEAAEP